MLSAGDLDEHVGGRRRSCDDGGLGYGVRRDGRG